MTKAQALYSFWAQFNWVTVDEQSLYDESTMTELGDPTRYISFESAIGEIGDKVTLNADLWHKSTSWATVEQKAEEIYNAISYGGVFVPYDGGAVWITRRDPAYTRMEAAENMRRIHFNINAEFLSA